MIEQIRILLLSDQVEDEGAVQAHLNESGVPCLLKRINSKEELIRDLKMFQPDFIISCCPVSGFAPFESIVLVKAFGMDVPFICLSKEQNPEAAAECIKAGATDFIVRDHLVRLSPVIQSLLVKKRIVLEKERAENALQYRLNFENIIVKLSNSFINLKRDEIDLGIRSGLRHIGEFVGADRSYIFLMHGAHKNITNVYEWCAKDISSQMSRMQDVPQEAFPWFMKKIVNFEVVDLPRMSELPDVAAQEKREFDAQGIKSLLNVPLVFNGEVIGFLGFDAVRREQQWPEEIVSLMRIAGEMFANAITRRTAEALLVETKEKYYTLMEDANDAIFLLDTGGQVMEANKKAQEILGYSKAEFSQLNLVQLAPAYMVERARALFRSVLHNGKGMVSDAVLMKKDGSTVTGDIAGSVVEYGGKRVVQGIFMDTTARKKMEDALRDKERFLANVFNSIQDGVSILDCDLNIVGVNPVLEKWHSYVMPIVGKKCYEAYHNATKPCAVCPTLETLKTKKAAFATIPKGGPKGKVVGWLELYSFPLFDTSSGELKGVIEYVRDVSERKKVELEREKLTSELMKTNKRLKQLSLRDPQTGLYNHHYLAEVMDVEFYRATRYGSPLSVIMLDIDYFRSINDIYGHRFGDRVIKQFSVQLKKIVRRYDITIRYDGEAFLIICPGLDRNKALILGQRLLDAVTLYNFGTKKNSVKLKMSVGVIAYPEDPVSKGIDLVELAEKLVDKAKDTGGNRVYCSTDVQKGKVIESGSEYKERSDVHTLVEQIAKLNKRAHRHLTEAIFGFAKTIELKDYYTGKHVESTVHYATEIAKGLRLPSYDVELIRQASMLHDLGKIGISEKILSKKSSLTPKEFEEIKKHPRIAVDILRPIHFFHALIPLILYHHERWDGKGYPEGLRAEEIPVGARVVAVADVFQALVSDRPYHRAFSESKAIEILQNESGKRFDPAIVEVFVKILTRN